MLDAARDGLVGVLQHEGVKEVKFEEVGTHAARLKAVKQFLHQGVECAAAGSVRIDVVTWDTHDSRHRIEGRDDTENLGRMYYHVLRHVARAWGSGRWRLYPDENSAMDWKELEEILGNSRVAKRTGNLPLPLDDDSVRTIEIESIEPVQSIAEPLVQMADLFVGMARFARERGQGCAAWLAARGGDDLQGRFPFNCLESGTEETKRTESRYAIVSDLVMLCEKRRLGVNLQRKSCLWTPKPTNPINFWNYEPQGEYDRAPTR